MIVSDDNIFRIACQCTLGYDARPGVCWLCEMELGRSVSAMRIGLYAVPGLR